MAGSPSSSRRMLKKAETVASSFDRLRMRLRQAQDEDECIQGLRPHGALSRFGGLTVRPWATSFFSILLEKPNGLAASPSVRDPAANRSKGPLSALMRFRLDAIPAKGTLVYRLLHFKLRAI